MSDFNNNNNTGVSSMEIATHETTSDDGVFGFGGMRDALSSESDPFDSMSSSGSSHASSSSSSSSSYPRPRVAKHFSEASFHTLAEGFLETTGLVFDPPTDMHLFINEVKRAIKTLREYAIVTVIDDTECGLTLTSSLRGLTSAYHRVERGKSLHRCCIASRAVVAMACMYLGALISSECEEPDTFLTNVVMTAAYEAKLKNALDRPFASVPRKDRKLLAFKRR